MKCLIASVFISDEIIIISENRSLIDIFLIILSFVEDVYTKLFQTKQSYRRIRIIISNKRQIFYNYYIYTVETRNLEVPGTCKNNSKHPEIDSSESGFLHVIEI